MTTLSSTRQRRAVRAGSDLETGRTRLHTLYTIAAVTLGALIPLIFLAGFWMRSELNRNQHDTETFLSIEARGLSARLDSQLREQLSALTALAALPSLDNAAPDAFAGDAVRVMDAMKSWSLVGLIDIDTGQHLVSQGGAWSSDNERATLDNVKRTGRPAIDSNGRRDGNVGAVLLYAPVSRAGVIRSALVAAVAAPELSQVTAAGQNGELFRTIMDARSQILARSQGAERLLGDRATDDFKAASENKQDGLFEGTSLDGKLILAAYHRSDLTGWVSFVAKDRRQLDAAAKRSLWATIAASALALVLVVILAVFVFHTTMERRVSNERLAASRALGDLDARLLSTTQEALDEQRKAASEREVLLREIYHRVKNNLQIVQSLLRLGSRDLKPDQREPFESAVRRIGAMARVHTLLYNSPDLASIDFKDYLDELLRELSEGFGAEERMIEHVLEAQSLRLPLDTAVPLAFISVEILTNAFRHAFPEGRPGKINVSASRDGLVGKLRIEDNGIGLTADQRTKRRLGLTIVAKLVQQIGGSMEDPVPGSSAFTITFPLEAEGDSAHAVERALDRHRDALSTS
jgi:two-component sensor histidine kinase